MKRYNKYKDSGIEWIGEIPEHWEVERLGFIGQFTSSGIDKKIKENEQEVKIINYTDVYGNNNHILDSLIEYMIVTTPKSKIEQHLVKRGDLIFTPSSETKEDIGLSALVSEQLGNTAFSYHVLRFHFNREVNDSFKKYMCNNHFVLNYFSKNAQGTTRQTLDRNDFKTTFVLIPPITEQTSIANYLDRKTAQIDQLIEDKKRLIELYEEEKTAIINQAVTRGLDPNVPMKESGIEWLGEIPEHWEVTRMANFGNFFKGKGISKSDLTDDGVSCVLYGDIYTKYKIKTSSFIRKTSRVIAEKSIQIFKNDLLLTASGETPEDIGKCILYTGDIQAFAGGDVIIFRQSKHNSYYLTYLFNSYSFQEQKAKLSKGEIVVHIYSSQLRDIYFPIPSNEEQQIIVEYIENQFKLLDTKKAKTEKLIDFLTEYRTALISEVVTGKIKVTD